MSAGGINDQITYTIPNDGRSANYYAPFGQFAAFALQNSRVTQAITVKDDTGLTLAQVQPGNQLTMNFPAQLLVISGPVDTQGGAATVTLYLDPQPASNMGGTVGGAVTIIGSITIGNAVSITGTVSVAGSVTVSNTVAISGSVSITGSVSVGNTVAISGAVTVSGSVTVSNTVAISGSVSITGNVTVGNTTLNPVAVSGSVTVSNTVAISGTVSISGNVTIGNTVTVTGTMIVGSISSTVSISGTVQDLTVENNTTALVGVLPNTVGAMTLTNNTTVDTTIAKAITGFALVLGASPDGFLDVWYTASGQDVYLTRQYAFLWAANNTWQPLEKLYEAPIPAGAVLHVRLSQSIFGNTAAVLKY